jgi:hypothetical protein
MALPLEDHVGLTPAQLAALRTLLASHHTLEDVARWRIACEVIAQDEYSLDVVVAWDDALFLVYDTT